MLEYSVGPEHSYVWAVSHESVTSYELPKQGEIDLAAREIYGVMTARQPIRGETQLQYLSRVTEADARYQDQAVTLGHVLLGPVASLLGRKRLLIVADGSLGYLPFAALSSSVAGNSYRPLSADHEIVYSPSASTLAVLRRQIAGRASAPKALAVLADPVLQNSHCATQG